MTLEQTQTIRQRLSDQLIAFDTLEQLGKDHPEIVHEFCKTYLKDGIAPAVKKVSKTSGRKGSGRSEAILDYLASVPEATLAEIKEKCATSGTAEDRKRIGSAVYQLLGRGKIDKAGVDHDGKTVYCYLVSRM